MEDTVQVLLQRHYRGNQPSVEHRTPLVPEDAVADFEHEIYLLEVFFLQMLYTFI